MSWLATTHIVIPVVLAFMFIYFTLLLNHILWVSVMVLAFFLILFVLYGLSTYSLFNHQPGFESYESAQGPEAKLSVDRIGQYKENERKMGELLLLMREDIDFGQLEALRREYVQRYQQPSFCNTCEIIKTPRTFHCQLCDKCVLRREKHSEIVNMCIGARNIKIFIQYLFISMVLSGFMVLSLVLVATVESTKINELSELQLTLFAIFEIVVGASVLLFAKEFFISFFNARDNITETERKLDIITKKNNPFRDEKYYDKLFRSNLDLVKIEEIADPTNWLEFNDQIEADPPQN